MTLDQPISTTLILAEIAEGLVRRVLVDHAHERTISLLGISVSHLEEKAELQLELPLGLRDELAGLLQNHYPLPDTHRTDLDDAPQALACVLTLLAVSVATTALAVLVISRREFYVKTPESN